MIEQAIEILENHKSETIEKISLSYHLPGKGVYVIVDENFNYKILSRERFSFNSKYIVMDYFSQIINTNKAVDSKKQITSNNYLTFFCKNISKLTDQIIDNYYDKLPYPDKHGKYLNWIKLNIYDLAAQIGKNQLIKIFFYAEIQDYIKNGRIYYYNNILSNTLLLKDELVGVPQLINMNMKKPYIVRRSLPIPHPVLFKVKQAYKRKCFLDLLESQLKRGLNITYITSEGKMISLNNESPRKKIIGGLIFCYDFDRQGQLRILEMDNITSYNPSLV